jgi:hypothetical protein
MSYTCPILKYGCNKKVFYCYLLTDPRLSQEAGRSKFKNYAQLCNTKVKLAKGVAYQKIKNYILNGSPVLITMPVNSTFKCLKSTDTVC